MSGRKRQRGKPEPLPEPFELDLGQPAFGGEVISHLPDGRVVFVAHGLPGERAQVAVHEARKDFAKGQAVQVLQPSERRVDPPCPYFTAGCGGCSWQHADYAYQLEIKRGVVIDQMRRIGHFDEPAPFVRPTIGMLEPWHYRNQARFTLGRRMGELCFTYRSSHRLMRVDHCSISHPRINETVELLQGKLAGLERHVHQIGIRVGANTGGLLVTPALPEVPELPSGQTEMEEELLGRRFRIAPQSFFQVNTRRELRDVPDAISRAWLPIPSDGVSMAELLALLVLDRVQPRPSDLLVDAYGGVGTFALLAAPLVDAVVGIEEARSAVVDANHNGRDVSNARFVEGKSEDVLPQLSLSRRPDAVILDPARVGAHPAVLEALLSPTLRPERLVYVSCDPTTLARDLRVLVDGGYQLQEVQPLDMFPQTYHVECVATLVA